MPDLGIEIHVIEIREGRVRLGVLAPQCVTVYRQEIIDRMDGFVVQSKPMEGTHAPTQQGGDGKTVREAAAGGCSGAQGTGASSVGRDREVCQASWKT